MATKVVNRTPSKAWQPYAALVIGLVAVSSSSVLIRFAQNENAPSLLISWWRTTLAALILTPIIFSRYRQAIRALKPAEIGLAMLSGAFLAAHFATWITSLEYTSVLISATLVTTNPLMVAMLTPLLLREKLSLTTLGAILLGLVGGIIISVGGSAGDAPKQNAPALGALLALAGALAVALYYIIGRRLRSKLEAIPYIWLTYSSAGIVLLVVLLISGTPIAGHAGNAYLWMTLIGLIPQLIGHSSFNYALGYLSAALVSLTVQGEPIISTILAIMLFGASEAPQPIQIVGSVLIITALVIASRSEARAHAEAQKQDQEIAAGVQP